MLRYCLTLLSHTKKEKGKKTRLRKKRTTRIKGINTGICIKMQHTRRVYD